MGDFARLHVAHEVEALIGRQQRVGFLGQGAALFGLRAIVDQADARVLNAARCV